MIYEFEIDSKFFRVDPLGQVYRNERLQRGIAREDVISLSPTQRRIITLLVRTNQPVLLEDIAERCLPPRESESEDLFALVQRHIAGLQAAMGTRGLVKHRREKIEDRLRETFRLSVSVRHVAEVSDMDRTPFGNPSELDRPTIATMLLAQSDWLWKGARERGETLEALEVGCLREDGNLRLLGYAAGPFTHVAGKTLLRASIETDSSFIEWADVEDVTRVEWHTWTDTDELILLSPYARRIHVGIGLTGAGFRLTWTSVTSDPNAGSPPSEESPNPVRFETPNASYSITDGRRVTRHVASDIQHTVSLGSRPARLLLLFLERGPLGPITDDVVREYVWPDVEAKTISSDLIRQTVRRVREAVEPNFIKSVSHGVYRLNAHVNLPERGPGESPSTEPAPIDAWRVPVSIVLPGEVRGSEWYEDSNASIDLHEIRGIRPDGMIGTLGLSYVSSVEALAHLLDSSTDHGRRLISWARLEAGSIRAVEIPADRKAWRVSDADDNVIYAFLGDRARLTPSSIRLAPPGGIIDLMFESILPSMDASAYGVHCYPL